MEYLKGKSAYDSRVGNNPFEVVLLDQFMEIEDFHLRSYSELEAYFEDPIPLLDIELTSAAVIPKIVEMNSILLVQTTDSSMPTRIELPSGSVNRDLDVNIYETAIREFREETGLDLSINALKPLGARYYKDGKGGLQFLADISAPPLPTDLIDELGRQWYIPLEGTDNGRTVRLISEPLELFLDPKLSLLKHSKHPWAVDRNFRECIRLISGA